MNPEAVDVTRSGLFAGIAPADAEAILGACDKRIAVAGEVLVTEGEEGDALFIIQSGRIEIFKLISPDVDRVMGTYAAGEVVGAMSFADGSRRSASARTSEPCEFAVLTRATFDRIARERPAAAAAFYRNLAVIIAGNLRGTLDLYRDAVFQALEATGASGFALKHLVDDLRPVTVHLAVGASLSARIIQMDHGPAGHTLVLKDERGRISIVPYHAIQRIDVA